MATLEQITLLRSMINQPTNEQPWTDDVLSVVIDSATSLDAAAATVWEGKAASVAHLVDISEGGSSRKMGDLYEQFIKMATLFSNKANPGGVAAARAPMTREITRS